jgi:hypothetical protein
MKRITKPVIVKFKKKDGSTVRIKTKRYIVKPIKINGLSKQKGEDQRNRDSGQYLELNYWETWVLLDKINQLNNEVDKL